MELILITINNNRNDNNNKVKYIETFLQIGFQGISKTSKCYGAFGRTRIKQFDLYYFGRADVIIHNINWKSY